MTGCEAAGEENALLRSGPLRPAFEKEVQHSTFGFQAFPVPRYVRLQTYTGWPIQNRGRTIKSWTKWAEIRQIFQSHSGLAQLFGLDAGACIFLHHELGLGEFRKAAAFCHQFIESSGFDHVAIVENQDARGVANG